MPYPIRKIEAEEQEKFMRTLSIPFCMDLSPGVAERFRVALEHADLCAAFDGDEMVSTFGSYNLNLTVPGGVQVPTAGTTVVTVLPTHRRRGILRAHMFEHFRDARDKEQPLAALWAAESHIYGRFGYGPAADAHRITIQKPHARLAEPVDIAGSMRLVDEEEALRVFPAIHSRVAKNRTGMFDRSPQWWKLRNLADPEELRRGATSHRRVLHLREGEPAGYAIYRTLTNFTTYTNELQLIELIGQDPAAEKALWQYSFGVDLVASLSHWNLAGDDPLLWWIEQPRELQRKVSDSIWVRPVDVAEALRLRRYASAGRVVFRFRDEYCPWNEGTYLLETDRDGTARCEKTDASPELELTPYSLGSVYLAGRRVWDLARAGLITGSPEAIHTADGMFGWTHLPWCPEIF